ncbi:MAG TPA: hypothetical protein VFZ19_00740 [Solirubrobacterales bacterium]
MRAVAIRSLAGFLLVAALTGIAACGSEDSETTTALTKQQFVKQANAICKAGLEEVRKVNVRLAGAQKMSKAEQEQMVRDLVPPFQAMLDELNELPAPEADQQKIDGIIASFEDALELLDTKPSRGLEGEYVFAEAADPAREYGLTDCIP